MRTYEIVTDRNMLEVHGSSDFGNMTPREVINEGVYKAALGHDIGMTQYTILRAHKLCTKRVGWRTRLTQKGFEYARAMHNEENIRLF